MISFGKKIPAILTVGARRVAVLWLGPCKIWEAVRSCFGSGRWIGRKPWLGKERWRRQP